MKCSHNKFLEQLSLCESAPGPALYSRRSKSVGGEPTRACQRVQTDGA